MTEATEGELEAARAFVARVLEVTEGTVPLDGSVETVLAWDSLGHVRILLAIEAETGKALDSDLVASLRSIADVARALAIRA